MDCILKYFPNLSETQINQFKQLGVLYPEWNEKINVISRKDIDNLYPTNYFDNEKVKLSEWVVSKFERRIML